MMAEGTVVPFQSKGDVAEWQLVYEELRKLDVGEEITYRELSAILARPFAQNRGPLYRAQTELLHSEQRALETVRRRGYRVVPAVDQRRLARRQQKFSLRRLSKGRDLVENVRVVELSPTDARMFELHAMALVQLEHLSRRQMRTEHAVVAVKSDVTTLETESEVLRRRVDALEASLRRFGETG